MKRSSCFAFMLMVAVAGCSPTVAKRPEGGHAFVHRVNFSGENFGRISAWYTGDYENWKMIADDNPKLSANNLQIGDEISVRPSLVIRTTPMPESFLHAALVKDGEAPAKVDAPGKALAGKSSAAKNLSAKKRKAERLKLAKAGAAAEKKPEKGIKRVAKQEPGKKDTSMKLARACAETAGVVEIGAFDRRERINRRAGEGSRAGCGRSSGATGRRAGTGGQSRGAAANIRLPR